MSYIDILYSIAIYWYVVCNLLIDNDLMILARYGIALACVWKLILKAKDGSLVSCPVEEVKHCQGVRCQQGQRLRDHL